MFFKVATADIIKPDEDSNCINVARESYKDMMVENLLNFGLSGWMADFGEYVPLAARTRCPSKSWGKLNHGRVLHKINSKCPISIVYFGLNVVFLGLIFQLPNILMILGLIGLIDRNTITRTRRYIYTGFAVIAAILTPPDPLTMIGLWVPLVLLFEVGVIGLQLIVSPYLSKKIK